MASIADHSVRSERFKDDRVPLQISLREQRTCWNRHCHCVAVGCALRCGQDLPVHRHHHHDHHHHHRDLIVIVLITPEIWSHDSPPAGPTARLLTVPGMMGAADIISTVEFNSSGELLATGDKGGRVVVFQREQESKSQPQRRGEYNVYSTFQSHEPEFDYLKSLEIEEKINKIKWLPQQNAAYFLLSTNDKTVKLWKISERDKRPEGYNLKDDDGRIRDPSTITSLRVPVLQPMDLMVEATARRVFSNAHMYHINSISVNSDYQTYISTDDLRVNLWNLEITDRSFSILFFTSS
ncbi:hypothetical protein F7725_009871 [Dissostichus mawsoni]|uniref:Serine/threonine-protein phosphatase 2A 55 kDa regulatory subunit B n=1 Tax=Dissostichus mawsoni TaxID=36200 RepID=A0A7J5XMM2_DISMA|nr:hypothetical protein F7725_009871 [Dissostichus mawsoni]